MDKLEVSARMTIREGKLDGFKQQAAECIRQTKEKDTKTLRYEWFISDDKTQCEIREAYVNSDGLIEHRMHVGEALDVLDYLLLVPDVAGELGGGRLLAGDGKGVDVLRGVVEDGSSLVGEPAPGLGDVLPALGGVGLAIPE